jgi:FlaA1/EpsC-like NDP-sugar epimerase
LEFDHQSKIQHYPWIFPKSKMPPLQKLCHKFISPSNCLRERYCISSDCYSISYWNFKRIFIWRVSWHVSYVSYVIICMLFRLGLYCKITHSRQKRNQLYRLCTIVTYIVLIRDLLLSTLNLHENMMTFIRRIVFCFVLFCFVFLWVFSFAAIKQRRLIWLIQTQQV